MTDRLTTIVWVEAKYNLYLTDRQAKRVAVWSRLNDRHSRRSYRRLPWRIHRLRRRKRLGLDLAPDPSPHDDMVDALQYSWRSTLTMQVRVPRPVLIIDNLGEP